MAIEVKCPQCGKTLSIAAEHATWQVKCRWCSHLFIPTDEGSCEAPSVTRKSLVTWQFYLLPPLVIIVLIIVWMIDLYVNPKCNYESGAIANLRTISSAEELYKTRNGRYCSLADLYTLGVYIDESLSQATCPRQAKAGYYFTLTVGNGKWSCTAIPTRPGKTATRSFYIDQTGAIYWAVCESEDDPPAGPDSKLLGK